MDMLEALLVHRHRHRTVYNVHGGYAANTRYIATRRRQNKKKICRLCTTYKIMYMLISCTWQNKCKLKSWIISRVRRGAYTLHTQPHTARHVWWCGTLILSCKLRRSKYRFNPRTCIWNTFWSETPHRIEYQIRTRIRSPSNEKMRREFFSIFFFAWWSNCFIYDALS